MTPTERLLAAVRALLYLPAVSPPHDSRVRTRDELEQLERYLEARAGR